MSNHKIPPDLDIKALTELMGACAQNAQQSVLQHGESVWLHAQKLLDWLESGNPLEEWWRVPSWLDQSVLNQLPSIDILQEYTVYHDCGKPFCKETDGDGKVHFPHHAQCSEQVWLAAGGNPHAARLMGMDMDIHLLRSEAVDEFASRPEATTLLLVGLAEVHSNAQMFGGVTSDSFKIKAKHIAKRGAQVLKAKSLLTNENNINKTI